MPDLGARAVDEIGSGILRKRAGWALIGVLVLLVDVGTARAQEAGQRIVKGERYIPAIWVDADGCEHWVLDDGAEGFMSPHLTREGLPVCRESDLCATVRSDEMFAAGSARISPAGRQSLIEFFQGADAASFTIIDHTYGEDSGESVMHLSQRRATAVAEVARSAGARIANVHGYGDWTPRPSNDTAEGMAHADRVEIMCWR